jgi:hypothetical protein|tara:strand:+ start:215 stop:568 length:354 start_codon:yes stop_codon:yes gene_type:complete
MSHKEQLVENIKKWVKIDNEIKELKRLQNERKEAQKELSENLMKTMKENDIDMFDLKQGSLHYKQNKIKKPITKKMLQDVLLKYYNNDLAKATDINEFILNNREETVKETLVHKLNK